MTCNTLQGKYAEKLEKEAKRMNETIEKLYKKLDALDSIIDQQALEISQLKEENEQLKERLRNEEEIARAYLNIEETLDKAIELIKDRLEYVEMEELSWIEMPYEDYIEEYNKLLEILGGGE